MDGARRRLLQVIGLAFLGVLAKPVLALFSRPKGAAASPVEGGFVHTRWAMVINLKACVGCNECVDACHRTHNVPSFGNPKDEVKWIWKIPYEGSFPEQKHGIMKKELRGLPTLVLCNHCDNPPCVPVCPVGAMWRRDDGLVMQDSHRCIGCRYCMVACPYGAISFNWRDPRPFLREVAPDFPVRRHGVVEKCTFCGERLAKGRRPACVEACEENALAFGNVEDPASEVRGILDLHYSLRRKPELGTKPQVYYIV